jgi:hypothetical protein
MFILIYFGTVLLFLCFWCRLALAHSSPICPARGRWTVGLTPPACLASLLGVLRNFADPEVRTSFGYQVLFVIAWGVTLLVVHLMSSLIGLDWLEDGLERRNRSAVWAGAGLTIGTTLAVAGANVGRGPTEATTLGPMILAVVGLLALWMCFAVLTGNLAAVTIERDGASGLRLASLLIAWGLIFGRAVAGDWVSAEATWRDYLQQGIGPAVVLLGFGCLAEYLERPGRTRPVPSFVLAGIVPACLFQAFAIAWVWHLGAPS